MYPTFEELDGDWYLFILIATFLLSLIFFRKNFWNLFDPLIITLFNLSFNVTIIIYGYFKLGLKPEFLYYVMICFALFCIAIKIGGRIGEIKFKAKSESPGFIGPNVFTTKSLIFFCVVFLTVNNLFLFQKVGLGIITGSVNPDTLKVTLTQGGAGIFQKFSLAGRILLVPLLSHAYFNLKIKKAVIAIFLYFFISLIFFNFSKSGLFFMLFDFGIVLFYFKKHLHIDVVKTKRIVLLGLVSVIPAFIVLSNVTSKYGVSITGLVIDRFIATGGGTYQYFVLNGNEALRDYSLADKFVNYFDVLLSSLKFKSWEPIGYVAKVTEAITGNSMPGFGANPYIFMDGYFLFNWFGILYCIFLGGVIGFVRNKNTGFLRFYLLNMLILLVVADPGTAQHYFVALLFFLPFYLIIKIVADLKGKTTTISYFKNGI